MRRFFVALFLVAGCGHDHSGHSHEKVEAQAYIVELRDDVDIDAFIDEHYLEPAERLPIVHGFSAELRPATVETLRADDRVERLTEDRPVDAL